MLTDATSSTLLADIAPPAVLTDAASSALLAFTALPPVLTRGYWHTDADHNLLVRATRLIFATSGTLSLNLTGVSKSTTAPALGCSQP